MSTRGIANTMTMLAGIVIASTLCITLREAHLGKPMAHVDQAVA